MNLFEKITNNVYYYYTKLNKSKKMIIKSIMHRENHKYSTLLFSFQFFCFCFNYLFSFHFKINKKESKKKLMNKKVIIIFFYF